MNEMCQMITLELFSHWLVVTIIIIVIIRIIIIIIIRRICSTEAITLKLK